MPCPNTIKFSGILDILSSFLSISELRNLVLTCTLLYHSKLSLLDLNTVIDKILYIQSTVDMKQVISEQLRWILYYHQRNEILLRPKSWSIIINTIVDMNSSQLSNDIHSLVLPVIIDLTKHVYLSDINNFASSLTTLSIRKHCVGNSDAAVLFKNGEDFITSLHSICPSLHTIKCSGRSIYSEDNKHINIPPSFDMNIQEFTLSNNYSVSGVMIISSNLQILNLSSCYNLTQIQPSSHFPTLIHLNLNYLNISETSMEARAIHTITQICPNLEQLVAKRLRSRYLSLLTVISNSLETIDISGNSVVLKAVRVKCPKLMKLTLELSSMLEYADIESGYIQSIDFSGTNLKTLHIHCPSLERLVLYGCYHLGIKSMHSSLLEHTFCDSSELIPLTSGDYDPSLCLSKYSVKGTYTPSSIEIQYYHILSNCPRLLPSSSSSTPSSFSLSSISSRVDMEMFQRSSLYDFHIEYIQSCH